MKTEKIKVCGIIVGVIFLLLISCSKKTENENPSYLAKWLGTYEGISYHWTSYLYWINGQLDFGTDSIEKKVLVTVTSSKDSCLDFTITYNDSIIEIKNRLKFPVSGINSSQWGDFCGYGTLNISLKPDTLIYHYIQKCGSHNSSGIDFMIKKK